MLTNLELGNLVKHAASRYGLRSDIVMAVVIQESACNTLAHRDEPAFFETYLKGKKLKDLSGWVPSKPGDIGQPSIATELRGRSQSWGLMQCMGDTARWCAKLTNPYFTALTIPEIGLDAGCRILQHYLHQEKGNYTRALARYNAGSVSARGLKYAAEVFDRVANKQHSPYIGT